MADNQSIEILKFIKLEIKGVEIETSYIDSIDIFESLTQPGITGKLSIQDYQGLRELSSVFAGDIIKLSYAIDGQGSDALVLEFVVYTDEGSMINPQHTYDTLQLGFCSKWLLDGLTKQVSKPYKDKYIHEIIQDILTTECSGAQIGYIEPTLQKMDYFLSPRWTPIHTIKYLLSFALNTNKIGGYIIWTDLKTDKINVTTLNYLMNSGIPRAINDFVILSSNQRYQGRIKEMNVESSFDAIRMVNNGIQQNVFYGFNFDTKKFWTSEDKITDMKNKRLSKKLPILERYKELDKNKKYARFNFCPLFPSTDNPVTDDDKFQDLIKGQLYNHYAFLSSDIFKINIETLGDNQRRVGQLVLLQWPSQSHNADGKSDQKQMKSNDYLIREIRHTFSAYLDYKQFVTLVIDGYQEYDAPIMNW